MAGAATASAATALALSTPAWADKPVDWQIWHQTAASPGMEAIVWFDWYTLAFIVPITLFVMALLGYVMWKFRASANPVPSQTTHNTAIEVVWTLAPVAILVAIAIPSFQLLTAQFNPPKEPGITIKTTGYQWYWGIEYQTGEDGAAAITYDMRPIGSDEIAGSAEAAMAERVALGKEDEEAYPTLLAVDNEIVVPVGEVVRVLVTAGDVIHNFAMPAFGLKMDGYPGRLNETFFQPTKEGLYYGQCSELCGKYHAYMPIGIRVVSQADYDTWAAAAAGGDVEGANKALMATLNAKKKVDVASN
ncbi:cytochrome c oxidase subunit II [Ahrensia sp. R2A130]|uniref:cytochrome c oxidase subunit II n=1 Tax=Ahrensia sp. R2A130 TaxID=744979 RepID=UPI000682F6C1|nr:cytochrome c oxidase subunit II [Ahrensia sp. R2A130]